jgi:thymidine kinase
MTDLGGGSVEVICGPMFSGKSEELIRRIRRATIAQQRVQVFKPLMDNRYALNEVMSHNKVSATAVSVGSAMEILEIVKSTFDPEVVGIDEAQFMGDGLAAACNLMANEGRRVIVAGLDMDYTGAPFENMAALLCRAEEVTKLSAVCMVCGKEASRTFRKSAGKEQIQIGGAKEYEARCRKCHITGELQQEN